MSLVKQLLQLVVVIIQNVCAQLQCTQHNQSLPIALDSAMLGYSHASQTAYLIGGYDGVRLDDVYKWDTRSSSDGFTSIAAPAPTVMDAGGVQIVATINDVMYIVSPKTQGSSPFTSGSAIHRFNTTTEQWLTPISFTTPLGKWLINPCVTHNHTHIILVDGFSHYRTDDPIYISFYSILQDSWTTHNLSAPFSTTGNVRGGWRDTYCSYAQDSLYIFGGQYVRPWDACCWINLKGIYKYELGRNARAFVSLGTLPTSQSFGIAVYDGSNYIYLVGGYNDNGNYMDAIRIFDVSSEQLLDETITAVFPLCRPVSMILDEQLWIFGGKDTSDSRVDIVQKCDVSSFTANPTTADPTTAGPTASPTTLITVLCGAEISGQYNGAPLIFDIEMLLDGDMTLNATLSSLPVAEGGLQKLFPDGGVVDNGVGDDNDALGVIVLRNLVANTTYRFELDLGTESGDYRVGSQCSSYAPAMSSTVYLPVIIIVVCAFFSTLLICAAAAGIYYARKKNMCRPSNNAQARDPSPNEAIELPPNQPQQHRVRVRSSSAQREAQHDELKVDDEPQFAQLLREWGLELFVKRFEEEGYTSVSVWSTVGLTDDELKNMGMRPGHIKTFQCQCAEMRECKQPGAALYSEAEGNGLAAAPHEEEKHNDEEGVEASVVVEDGADNHSDSEQLYGVQQHNVSTQTTRAPQTTSGGTMTTRPAIDPNLGEHEAKWMVDM